MAIPKHIKLDSFKFLKAQEAHLGWYATCQDKILVCRSTPWFHSESEVRLAARQACDGSYAFSLDDISNWR